MNPRENLAEKIEQKLPDLIKKIAKEYNSKPYLENPDFKESRLVKWHQFGIITHSKKVRKIFSEKLPEILKQLNIKEKIDFSLNKKIDNLTKYQLLEISIPLHDLGKIILLEESQTNRNHESASSQLVEPFLINSLLEKNLTSNQINYIKNCIKHHGTLGREIRDLLVPQNKFNLEYFKTREFKEICKKTAEDHQKIKTELGIYFLCDTLGKIDSNLKTEKDLEKQNLNPELKYALMQQPLTKKLAEIYLTTLF